MDKTALVERDLEAGERIVRALELAGVRVDLAAWLQHGEGGDWQLIVSSPLRTVEGGIDRIYGALMTILADLDMPDLHLGVVSVWSPSDAVVQNLKNLVRTGDELQRITLSDLDLGPKWFKSAVVYRSQGGRRPGAWLENGAAVRAKATGRQGVIWNRVRTPGGERYLVRHFLPLKNRRPRDGVLLPPDEQLYDLSELDFLYAVRPGGWPEKPPLIAQPA